MGEDDDDYDPQATKKQRKKKKKKKSKQRKSKQKKKEAPLKIDFSDKDNKDDDDDEDDDDDYNDVTIMDKTKQDDAMAADLQYETWMDDGGVEGKFDIIMETLNPAVDANESIGFLAAELIWKC